MNDWIMPLCWTGVGLFVGLIIWSVMASREVEASCNCGDLKVWGRVAACDASGLREQLLLACPRCSRDIALSMSRRTARTNHGNGMSASKDSWRPTAPRSSTECSS